MGSSASSDVDISQVQSTNQAYKTEVHATQLIKTGQNIKSDNRMSSMELQIVSKIKNRGRTKSIMPAFVEDIDGEINNELIPIFAGFDKFKKLLVSSSEDKEMFGKVNADLNEKILKKFDDFSDADKRKKMGSKIVKINLVEELVKYYKFVAKTGNITAFTMEVMEDEDDEDVSLLKNIRMVLWNFSDSSREVAVAIAEKTSMFSILAMDLLELHKSKLDDVSEENFPFTSAIGIIHNCARSDISREYYHMTLTHPVDDDQDEETDHEKNKDKTEVVEMIDCLLPFLKTQNTYVKMITLLALAHMVTEEQNSMIMADRTLFDFLLGMIKKAMKAKDRRSDGFSVEELLDGLAHLAKNDKNKSIIMEKKALPILKELALKGNVQEQTGSVKVIWELAFNTKNKKTFMGDKELWKKLYILQENENSELAKSAQGACFVCTNGNIAEHVPAGCARKPITAPVKGTPSDNRTQEQGGYIMISYNWNNQQILLKVRDKLQTRGYTVWMDVDNMEGDILEAMGRAVEGAQIVLMCYSEKYKDSKNCRTEAEYAYTRSKVIIPLLMQKQYIPDGWLGALVGSKLYFEFTDVFPFDKKMEELIKEIERKSSVPKMPAIKAPVPTEAGPTVKEIKVKVLDWTAKDMEKWLKESKLEKYAGLKTVTGEQLFFLYKLYRKAPEYFFKSLEDKLDLKSLEELMRFSDALEKLSLDDPAMNHML